LSQKYNQIVQTKELKQPSKLKVLSHRGLEIIVKTAITNSYAKETEYGIDGSACILIDAQVSSLRKEGDMTSPRTPIDIDKTLERL
jgi:hypothetical protein